MSVYLERYAPSFSSNPFSYVILKWTPRFIVAGLSGFYSLGLAYDLGIMAAIDRIAIRVLRHYVGFTGLGAIMPIFQWYAAWGIRAIAAITATLFYDLIERIVYLVYARFHPIDNSDSLQEAPLIRFPLFYPMHDLPLHQAPLNHPPLHQAPQSRKNEKN